MRHLISVVLCLMVATVCLAQTGEFRDLALPAIERQKRLATCAHRVAHRRSVRDHRARRLHGPILTIAPPLGAAGDNVIDLGRTVAVVGVERFRPEHQ